MALGREETPDLADVARREEVKVELQEEYRLSDEASLARDARIRAFFISVTLVVCLLLPLVGAGGVAEDTEAAAAIGLGLLGDRRAIAAIVPMLDRRGRPASRGHGAVALAMPGAVEALPSMRQAILKDRNPWVQRELAVALGLLRDGESVNALAGLVRGDGSEWDRANAACALGRIATPESALVMVGLLTSPRSSDSARGRVAEGLGPLLDTRPFPPLFAVAEDWDYGLELEVFRQVLHLL